MLPTVRAVLDLPSLRRGDPVVAAGAGGLDREVRWVHISELTDIAGLLSGGEMLLTTGIALPGTSAELRSFVRSLAQVDVRALVIELGRRYTDSLPASVVAAAEEHDLPLIALQHEVSFVAVTQAVHEIVVSSHVTELVASEEAHQTFDELMLTTSTDPQAVVDLVASMTRSPVVFEDLGHQVLSYNAAGEDDAQVIGDWERRSRRWDAAVRGADGQALLVADRQTADVALQGKIWGRLVVIGGRVACVIGVECCWSGLRRRWRCSA